MICDLERLKQFQNRQVVINFYEDDVLMSREGFHFETIKLQDNNLIFSKNNQEVYKLKWDAYDKFVIMEVFKNYYALKNKLKTTEIYFP